MSKNANVLLLRVQSPDGTKRIEVPAKCTLHDLYSIVKKSMDLNDVSFSLFAERNNTKEIVSSRTHSISEFNLKHGDMIYFKDNAGPSTSSRNMEDRPSTSKSSSSSSLSGSANTFNSKLTGASFSSDNKSKKEEVKEDEVDIQLHKLDGRIQRKRDDKLCRHNSNGCCVHCSPIEPWDENYLKEQKIKHLSFHSYLKKLTSGADRGKFVALEDMSCKIKSGCREHPPWPKGICSKCQPSAITLNRQNYRHVDNVMFENTGIVERFLNYWRCTGHQRIGYLYGSYEIHADVPLGIRARVAAIYEPPQESSRDTIKLLDDEHEEEVGEVADALGLRKVGWIFTDLITDNVANGTVKHLRGIQTHFLTAQECILAGFFQNKYPSICKYASNRNFGSKFVTVCVTGDETKQVHMEGYAVSGQCMALVRDNCLVPTKDAPELGYVRESSDKQFVPDVYYKEKDVYGNEVSRLGRPLPVEYLLVDIPASTPLVPCYTFPQRQNNEYFPVENRFIEGYIQDLPALNQYISKHNRGKEFIEIISDFHLLLYLYRMEMLPMKLHMKDLLEGIRTQNVDLVNEFKNNELWRTLEQLMGDASMATSADFGSSQMEVDWTCAHCTYINSRDVSTCEICNLPRV